AFWVVGSDGFDVTTAGYQQDHRAGMPGCPRDMVGNDGEEGLDVRDRITEGFGGCSDGSEPPAGVDRPGAWRGVMPAWHSATVFRTTLGTAALVAYPGRSLGASCPSAPPPPRPVP